MFALVYAFVWTMLFKLRPDWAICTLLKHIAVGRDILLCAAAGNKTWDETNIISALHSVHMPIPGGSIK